MSDPKLSVLPIGALPPAALPMEQPERLSLPEAPGQSDNIDHFVIPGSAKTAAGLSVAGISQDPRPSYAVALQSENPNVARQKFKERLRAAIDMTSLSWTENRDDERHFEFSVSFLANGNADALLPKRVYLQLSSSEVTADPQRSPGAVSYALMPLKPEFLDTDSARLIIEFHDANGLVGRVVYDLRADSKNPIFDGLCDAIRKKRAIWGNVTSLGRDANPAFDISESKVTAVITSSSP